VRQGFRAHGVTYVASELDRSALYRRAISPTGTTHPDPGANWDSLIGTIRVGGKNRLV